MFGRMRFMDNLDFIVYMLAFFALFFSFGSGLALIIGWGWAQVILDLISHSVSGDYEYLQKISPPKRGAGFKLLGISMMIGSVGLLIYLISLLGA